MLCGRITHGDGAKPNLLLGEPDRLIIEPTGLGHPAEVLGVLAADAYADRLELHTTVALVDARSLNDEQHCEHPSFIQQIEIADLVLANKADLSSQQDLDRLRGVFGFASQGKRRNVSR